MSNNFGKYSIANWWKISGRINKKWISRLNAVNYSLTPLCHGAGEGGKKVKKGKKDFEMDQSLKCGLLKSDSILRKSRNREDVKERGCLNAEGKIC